MGTSPPLLLLLLLLLLPALAMTETFNCTRQAKPCTSILGYKPPNATTYSSISSLFNLRSVAQLLLANNLSATSSPSSKIPRASLVRIPFACSCSNGTGVPLQPPVYVAQPDDGLYHIAYDIFGGFIDFQEIARFNGIPNPDVIDVGQRIKIPLPCSCDAVGGEEVVHYAYKVESGDTLAAIGSKFGTTETALKNLNGIADAKTLKEEQILDVPLKVCSSSVANGSLDSPLLVPGGYNVLTANDCIQCSCNSSSWRLQCKESNPFNRTCPAASCKASNLSLGNFLPTSLACQITTCEYAGYNKSGAINTILYKTSTCRSGGEPSGSPNGSPGAGVSNAASRLAGFGSIFHWVDLLLLGTIALFSSGFL